MRKLIIAVVAASTTAAAVAGLADWRGRPINSTATVAEDWHAVTYKVTSEVIGRLDDGSIIVTTTKPIGSIGYTDVMGRNQHATDVTYPYQSDRTLMMLKGSTASIQATSVLPGTIDCTIEIDHQVMVHQHTAETDRPTVACSATV